MSDNIQPRRDENNVPWCRVQCESWKLDTRSKNPKRHRPRCTICGSLKAVERICLPAVQEDEKRLAEAITLRNKAIDALTEAMNKLQDEGEKLAEAQPYMDAVRGMHNGYHPEARKVMRGLKEPENPKVAIGELLAEREEFSDQMLKRLVAAEAVVERVKWWVNDISYKAPEQLNGWRLAFVQEMKELCPREAAEARKEGA